MHIIENFTFIVKSMYNFMTNNTSYPAVVNIPKLTIISHININRLISKLIFNNCSLISSHTYIGTSFEKNGQSNIPAGKTAEVNGTLIIFRDTLFICVNFIICQAKIKQLTYHTSMYFRSTPIVNTINIIKINLMS